MTVAELLNHEIFDLPACWVAATYTDSVGQTHTCRSYHQFVNRRLKEYQDLLDQLDDISVNESPGFAIRVPYVSNAEEVRRSVKIMCNGIRRTLIAYANGSPSTAYRELCETLEPTVKSLLEPPAHHLHILVPESDQVFYRLRESSYPITNPQGLFHLPFELRWRAKAYRYSIAGYPSLYASTSALLALRELHQPTWHENLYAVRLRPIERVSMELPIRDVLLLDLRNRIEKLRKRYAKSGPYSGEVIGFLVSWPLIMATSIPTGHPPIMNEQKCMEYPGFNEEYILPQLLLEWVNNTRNRRTPFKATGIAFSSARVRPTDPEYADAYNIVVPAEVPAATGLCSVRIRQFEVSTPVALTTLLQGVGAGRSTPEIAHALEAELAAQSYHHLHMEVGPGA
jgi:hypothetical protein